MVSNEHVGLPVRCEGDQTAAWGRPGFFPLKQARNSPVKVSLRPCSSHLYPLFPDSWLHKEVRVISIQTSKTVHKHVSMNCTYSKSSSSKFGLVSSTSLKIALAWRRQWEKKCCFIKLVLLYAFCPTLHDRTQQATWYEDVSVVCIHVEVHS